MSFQLLCDCNSIPENEGRGFTIDEHQVFAVKRHGIVYVYYNRCPHLWLPLNWVPDKFLDAEGELIQCSSHGALFTIEDGYCVAGPCVNQSLARVTSEIREDQVYVDLD